MTNQQITEIAKLVPGGTIGFVVGVMILSRANEPCATTIDQFTSSVNTLCQNFLNSRTPDIDFGVGTTALAVLGALLNLGYVLLRPKAA